MTQTTTDDDATEEPLDKYDAKAQGRLVRTYSADGHLYAYEDGDEHVIVSRGDEPRTRWTERVPAERTGVDVGDHLWTIPENWKLIARENRDAIAYGIFEIGGTDKLVKASIPTNNWLVDAWYGVKRVGTDLTADADGTLGTADDVRALADDLESGEIDHRDDPEALRRVADHWDAVETDLEMAEEHVADEGIEQQRPTPQPLHLDDWMTEFQARQFRPGEVIDREVNLSDLDTDSSHLLDALRDEELLPSYYRFRISLEDN